MSARRHRAEAALTAAFVADAAALGLHWLYDPARIAEISGPVLFRAPDPEDFAGALGVFVHHGREAGDLSHYGAQLRAGVQAASEGSVEAMQERFVAAFGPGGWWTGYIDRPTRGTLANIAAERTDPSGVEDDQHPALPRAIALVCRPQGAEAAELRAAVEVTNLGEDAHDHVAAAVGALTAALDGARLHEALDAGIAAAPESVGRALSAARDSGLDPTAFAAEAGMACHLPQGLPVIWRILASAETAEAAIEANVRAGGDSCGRALLLGALLGASQGVGGGGVPLTWALMLRDGPDLAVEIAAATGD